MSGEKFPYPYPIFPGTTVPNDSWKQATTAFYLQSQIARYRNPVIRNLSDLDQALTNGIVSGSGLIGLLGFNSSLSGARDSVEASLAATATSPALPLTTSIDAILGLSALTALRQDLELWMTVNGVDALIAPTMGVVNPFVPTLPCQPIACDYLVDRFEVDVLGLPAITVPSGYISLPGVDSSGLWTGLQFIGRLAGEAPLLGFAYDYEQATQYRLHFPPDLSTFTVAKPGTPMAVLV